MKRKKMFMIIVAFIMANSMSYGQELLPLKSFDNDAAEYLRSNFTEKNTLFNGNSFGDFINAVEVEFLMAKVSYKSDKSSLFMYLYIQSPEYVEDTSLKEKCLSETLIFFEESSDLENATREILTAFHPEIIGPIAIILNNENLGRLIDLLKNCKIRKVTYRDSVRRIIMVD